MPWAWLLLVAFFLPIAEALCLVAGEWWLHVRFEARPSNFTRLIIQITTVGREEDRVNEIIAEIRSHHLGMRLEIWVVNEPAMGDRYPAADRVVTVDPSFEALSEYKARALEYSRRIRGQLGLDRPDVKILFLDDDTSPTRAYIETAFAADYDVCQGVTTPRIQYGRLPLRHFFLSHMDDLRFLSCLIYCSFFQGVVGRPLYVHGEGLCVTGEAERIVTWNYPVFASEDLVFGTNAASRGLSWGFFHEYIELTSPWTWDAYLKQRRRWLWGNIHAIVRRNVMPLAPALMVAFRYAVGFVTFVASLAGVVVISAHVIDVPSVAYIVFWVSFGLWTGAFAFSGWVNSGRVARQDRWSLGHLAFRLWQALMAVLLCPLTVVWTMIGLAIALVMGNPRRFEVIAKTAATAAV
jgi:cellulose synthase/poly-beta-1,6-N-acetylglucosamine synthase-like glycosyltransferase